MVRTDKSELLTVRMGTVELEEVRADAKAFGDTMSNWTRRCLRQGRLLLRPGIATGAKDGNSAGKIRATVTKGTKHGKKAKHRTKK
ncbi:MAG: hypothetical protein ACRENK_16420 [Gemmatimonadaceae bacterium]